MMTYLIKQVASSPVVLADWKIPGKLEEENEDVVAKRQYLACHQNHLSKHVPVTHNDEH
ncbi:hypothetical protein DPMN_111880 [Dreissena polymorpha]|uniref:Uncharacterized protein n=1 Tax=Dreissena polymorpha TaxID=45954 RepID=A0A9D4QQD2_DREPO|nr:hypothetical protein DPMN_111880 [Dreissena polymorpha]